MGEQKLLRRRLQKYYLPSVLYFEQKRKHNLFFCSLQNEFLKIIPKLKMYFVLQNFVK